MLATKSPIANFTPFHDWADHRLWKAIRFRWYWFLISPCLAILLGLTFLRYKTPHYNITASLLVRDDSRGSDFHENALLAELGLPDATSSVENEIEILKSRTLLSQVIEDLHLTTQYFASGHLKTAELYEKTPYKATFSEPRTAKPGIYRIIRESGISFTLQTPDGVYHGTFGRKLKLPRGLAVIDTTDFKPASGYQYSFEISRSETVLSDYVRVLGIQAPNKTASLVNLTIQDALPKKGEAILKQLITRYQKASIEEKNKVADNTIAFINANLTRVSSELIKVEKDIEHFRRHHKAIDLAEDGRQALERLTVNASSERELAMHLKIIRLLEAHLHDKPATAIPSTLYRQDDNFAALVGKYNEMQLMRLKALESLTPQHPEVKTLENQLAALRDGLLEAIRHQRQELTLSIAVTREYGTGFNAEIAQLPGRQRALLSRSREQGIQQELYLFLLKKRMETAISRSANIANARVIDPPKVSPAPAYPNRQLTMLIAFMAGMMAPIGVLYVGQIFNNKIKSKEDIIQQCDATIIGEISLQSSAKWLPKAGNRTLINEQFRSLRTNIQFVSEKRQSTVILLTSAMANEGKSFVATHLSRSLALACRKVLLIDFDLRKPTLAQLLELQTEGISEFITHGGAPLVQKCGTVHPFDFIAAGAIFPGSGELMLSPKIAEVISTLKSRYDYVLLDSPPVGLVADARLLGQHADMTLYIVRQHFTFFHQLADIRKARDERQLPDLYIVLNGTRDLRRYQYNYY